MQTYPPRRGGFFRFISMKNILQHNIIIAKEEFVEKTKELLTAFKQKSPSLHIGLSNTNKQYAFAYEREQFIIVVPQGNQTAAKLYGNWDEALFSLKRTLEKEPTSAKVTLTLN